MTVKNSLQFTIHAATETDIAACQQLDLSYDTEYAWQMDVRDDEGAIMAGFRAVRLPRRMRVAYPHEISATAEITVGESPKSDAFLVAETGGTVCGFLLMRIDLPRGNAWITDLAVGRAWRRRKIASALLLEAYNRAQKQHLQRLTVETQTKNYPGICFCQKNGLTFCGYNDHYYPNHDIALFFGQNIHSE